MRRWWLGLLFVACCGTALRAEDPAPPTVAQAADLVAAAILAKDAEALRTLATSEDPDPWEVADHLCATGRHDAATAFADVVPPRDAERLPGYVAGRAKAPDEAVLRAALTQARLDLAAGRAEEALLGVGAVALEGDAVAALAARGVRMDALGALRRGKEALEAALDLSARARALGWIRLAVHATMRAGSLAFEAGDPATAAQAWREALALHEQRDDRLSAAYTWKNLGLAAHELRDLPAAIEAYTRAAQGLEALEEVEAAASAWMSLGMIHEREGRPTAARAPLERALTLLAAPDLAAQRAEPLGTLGKVLGALGENEAALAALAEARALFEAAGAWPAAVEALLDAGAIHQRRGAIPRARAAFSEAQALARAKRCAPSEARAFAYLGALAGAAGDHRKALEQLGQALRVFQGLGDRGAEVAVTIELGHTRRRLCDYVEAARLFERAQALCEAAGERALRTRARMGLGALHCDLGDWATAQALLEESLTAYEALQSPGDVASVQLDLGVVLAQQGAVEAARARYEEALAGFARLGSVPSQAVVLANLGDLLLDQGDVDGAEQRLEQAEALRREGAPTARDVRAEIALQITRGEILMARAKPEEAERMLEKARASARSLQANDASIEIHTLLAKVRLARKEPALALETADGALPLLEHLAGGQGEALGSGARARYAELYATGLEAAVAAQDAEGALAWLESGRAGALLEALGGPEALQAATLPPELRAARADAAARKAAAYEALLRVLDGGTREARLAAHQELTAAQVEAGQVMDRTLRERKAGARVLYPVAARSQAIQGWLEAGEVLLAYGRAGAEGVAVVLEPEGAPRLVRLGPWSAILKAASDLDLGDTAQDPTPGIARLRRLLIEPLGLAAASTRLLVSPEGPLAYVPFGVLDPDREVAYVPSGTALGDFVDARGLRGTSVLALGDPDYVGAAKGDAVRLLARGRRLRPLPTTRVEVEAVGDRRLLGPEATFGALRAALAEQPRWRAVHLACHGFVNAEHPSLSALAITADASDDGFLTALEVCELRLATDLAVLSACDTGRGRVVPGEGLLGLARAFMLAGAPRVLCSLWKVDDEATGELMKRFYALWNPKDGSAGVTPAAALKQAQAEIRRQPKWQHPSFWAAWVLWGPAS